MYFFVGRCAPGEWRTLSYRLVQGALAGLLAEAHGKGHLLITMTAAATQQNKETLRESEKKWGKPAIAAGFTVIPSTLLAKQHALGLDCIDVVIILQILKHWWHKERAPYPSQVQLAKTMGTNLSTVKRHLTRLRELGFIDWSGRSNKHGGQAANAYDLSGLIKHVHDFAAAEVENRDEEKDARKARARRKKPVSRNGRGLRLIHTKGTDDD